MVYGESIAQFHSTWEIFCSSFCYCSLNSLVFVGSVYGPGTKNFSKVCLTLQWFLFQKYKVFRKSKNWKIWDFLILPESQGDRRVYGPLRKKIFCLLFHCLKDCQQLGLGQAKPRTAARYPILGSHMNGWNPGTGGISHCFPRRLGSKGEQVGLQWQSFIGFWQRSGRRWTCDPTKLAWIIFLCLTFYRYALAKLIFRDISELHLQIHVTWRWRQLYSFLKWIHLDCKMTLQNSQDDLLTKFRADTGSVFTT